jgi:dolichyl-phosphate beta-glucosyltransferase
MMSIVIPAFNEEKRINKTLSETNAYMSDFGMEYEIIVVDDGSLDMTRRIVESVATDSQRIRLVRYEMNRGKGHALRTGVLVTKGDFVLVMDADLSTPMEELRKLMPYLSDGRFDIAIGSRGLALSEIIRKQPWWRQAMGKMFNKIVKVLLMGDFEDTQCGFKLFKGEIARTLFGEAKIDRAKRKGLRMKEVPIRWVDSPDSRVDPVKDSLRMLIDLVRIRVSLGQAGNGGHEGNQREHRPGS